MRHYQTFIIKTGFSPDVAQVDTLDILDETLKSIGVDHIEKCQPPCQLKDRESNSYLEKGELIISCQYDDTLYSDIGFNKQANGTVEVIISNLDYSHKYSKDWLSNLSRKYNQCLNERSSKVAIQIADTAVFAKLNRHLKDVEVAILKGTWQGRTYKDIAEIYNCTAEYLIQDAGPKLWKALSIALEESVGKKNFRVVIERHKYPDAIGQPSLPSLTQDSAPILPYAETISEQKSIINREEMPDVSLFFDREEALATLTYWIVEENCRSIYLLGMPGIGKTFLATKLVENLYQDFDAVVWITLYHQPSLQQTLDLLVGILTERDKGVPQKLANANDKVTRIIHYISKYRCLIVLDGVDALLQQDIQSNNLGLVNLENYNYFLRRIGESMHQSCFLITSQEKPKILSVLDGDRLPVRSFQIPGLGFTEIKQILDFQGQFSGDDSLWQKLVDYYGGNPAALKLAGETITNLFEGDIASFLLFKSQETLIIDGMRELLDHQFSRLSDAEKGFMCWLANQSEDVCLRTAHQYLLSHMTAQEAFEVLQALRRRLLIVREQSKLIQLPVVRDYCLTISGEALSSALS